VQTGYMVDKPDRRHRWQAVVIGGGPATCRTGAGITRSRPGTSRHRAATSSRRPRSSRHA